MARSKSVSASPSPTAKRRPGRPRTLTASAEDLAFLQIKVPRALKDAIVARVAELNSDPLRGEPVTESGYIRELVRADLERAAKRNAASK